MYNALVLDALLVSLLFVDLTGHSYHFTFLMFWSFLDWLGNQQVYSMHS